MARLTGKQQRFVEEYLVDLNATQAAVRAGYSPKTAEAIGYENLRKPQIREAIEQARAERSERTEITQDMVLRELARVAFANGTDFARVVSREAPVTVIDEEGEPRQVMDTVQVVRVRDTDRVDPEKRAAIASIKEGKFGIEIKTYDKVKALELLGKHLGLFEDRQSEDDDSEVEIVMTARVKEYAK